MDGGGLQNKAQSYTHKQGVPRFYVQFRWSFQPVHNSVVYYYDYSTTTTTTFISTTSTAALPRNRGSLP